MIISAHSNIELTEEEKKIPIVKFLYKDTNWMCIRDLGSKYRGVCPGIRPIVAIVPKEHMTTEHYTQLKQRIMHPDGVIIEV